MRILSKVSFLVLFVLTGQLRAQTAPSIEWQTTLGGTQSDQAYGILVTTDGGCVFTGFSSSTDGDFKDHHGTSSTRDCIVGKLDAHGKVQWKESLGGSLNDGCPCIIEAHGGGYVLCGGVYSTDGDVSGHHGTAQNSDCWVVKLDTNGKILWQHCYGGSLDEDALRIVATDDGGYVFDARCYSNDGQVTGHHGGTNTSDYWVVKIDSIGKLLWEKSYGGTGDDAPFALARTDDNGFVLAGDGTSNDGDASGNHGGSDIWTIKIDDTGKLLWQHPCGGPGNEDMNSITLAADGGYIFGGSSYYSGGEITLPHYGHHDAYDIWVVKLSRDGKIVWQKSLGGNGHDYEQDVKATPDGGCLVSGYTTSNDIDVSGHHGDTSNYDGWIVELDSLGNLEWQKCLGGTGFDGATGIALTPDGGCVIACNTASTNGDVTNNHGGQDAWIVKLAPFLSVKSRSTDVAVDSIISPPKNSPPLTTSPIPVSVRFKNIGQTDVSGAKVSVTIGNTIGIVLYQDSTLLDGWKSGEVSQPVFHNFIAPLSGSYFAHALVELAGDQNSNNNFITWKFLVETASVSSGEVTTLNTMELEQNVPNPFTRSTTLAYMLPDNGRVSLRILDMTGRVVQQIFSNALEAAGSHSVELDLGGLSAAVYACELTFVDRRGVTANLVKKMTLIHR